jgi:hypothetical protein
MPAAQASQAREAVKQPRKSKTMKDTIKIDDYTITIEQDALYWASFDRFELRLPGECVLDCSHSGDCGPDVEAWAPRIREQIEKDKFRARKAKKQVERGLVREPAALRLDKPTH